MTYTQQEQDYIDAEKRARDSYNAGNGWLETPPSIFHKGELYCRLYGYDTSGRRVSLLQIWTDIKTTDKDEINKLRKDILAHPFIEYYSKDYSDIELMIHDEYRFKHSGLEYAYCAIHFCCMTSVEYWADGDFQPHDDND